LSNCRTSLSFRWRFGGKDDSTIKRYSGILNIEGIPSST
jgi:hypothetical protein